jgi:hypothetical protein
MRNADKSASNPKTDPKPAARAILVTLPFFDEGDAVAVGGGIKVVGCDGASTGDGSAVIMEDVDNGLSTDEDEDIDVLAGTFTVLSSEPELPSLSLALTTSNVSEISKEAAPLDKEVKSATSPKSTVSLNDADPLLETFSVCCLESDQRGQFTSSGNCHNEVATTTYPSSVNTNGTSITPEPSPPS